MRPNRERSESRTGGCVRHQQAGDLRREVIFVSGMVGGRLITDPGAEAVRPRSHTPHP